MAEVAYQYIDETGVIVPDTQFLKDEVTAEYVDTFGTDLVISDDTPQGVLIVGETTARDEVVRNNAAVANQINPNEAGGVALDAILALTGSERQQDSYSTTPCILAGVPGTVISEGTNTAKNTNGDIFAAATTVTLGINGQAAATFKAIAPGPISAQAGTLTTIYQGTLGWETITNTADATLGTLKQSDGEARQYRRNTLALQGTSLPLAITSALYATPGVASLTFRENYDDITLVIDGVTMQPHCIFVCVDGGSDNDVANVLLAKKTGGTGYNNSQGTPVTVNLVEPASEQTYIVKFSRPLEVEFDVQITVSATSSVIGDPIEITKQAILAYTQNRLPEEAGLGVGVPVSSFELAGAVNLAAPGMFVRSCKTRKTGSGDPFSSDELEINIWEIATTTSTNIVVTVA